jgi:hypothetical protein
MNVATRTLITANAEMEMSLPIIPANTSKDSKTKIANIDADVMVMDITHLRWMISKPL